VNEAMQDDDLHELLDKVRTTRTARQTYKLAFPILERLRELGFCKRPDDPEEDDEEDAGTDSGPSDGKPDGDGGTKSGASGSSSGSDNASPSSGKPSSDGGSSSGSSAQEDGGGGNSDDDTNSGGAGGSSSGDDEADGGDSDDAASGTGDNKDGDDQTEESDGDELAADEVQGDVPEPRPEPGEPDEFEAFIDKANGHEELKQRLRYGVLCGSGSDDFDDEDSDTDDKAIIIAILQDLFFDAPSKRIDGVREHHFTDTDKMRDHAWNPTYSRYHDLEVPETILGSALMKLRIVLSENARRAKQMHLKSGRVNGRVLGKRAPLNDDRLFMQRSKISKREYKVVLGVDISGSTSMDDVIALIKRAVMAQASMLSRLGIDFAIYAHTGGSATIWRDDMFLDIYVIKEFSDPWDDEFKQHLRDLTSTNANLDGHTLEYYRRTLDKVRGTDKILVYYTDGAMPLENYEEELDILLREINILKQKRYPHLFVGVRNAEPADRYGLPMVRLDSDNDIIKVVDALGAAIVRS
jgi:hypothetical protein